jgi:flagellar biosynthetic protein FliR
MPVTEAQLQTWLAMFFWPFLRIGAMIMSAPVFNSTQVPVRFRLLLAVIITLIIAPTIPQPPPVDPLGLSMILLAAQQILIGIAMGLILQMAFGAMVFAGQVIAHKMGLGFAMMVDPQNGVSVPVISQYYLILATFVFLFLNGHLILIDMLARSFHSLPIGASLAREDYRAVAAWGSIMFSGGLLVALPAVAALLLVNLGFGVITRAAPQLHIFAIGFPLAMLIGFVLIWLSLPGAMNGFEGMLEEAFASIRQILLLRN